MKVCLSCNDKVKFGNQFSCPNCGRTFCSSCADKTKKICPDCYHDLEVSG